MTLKLHINLKNNDKPMFVLLQLMFTFMFYSICCIPVSTAYCLYTRNQHKAVYVRRYIQ